MNVSQIVDELVIIRNQIAVLQTKEQELLSQLGHSNGHVVKTRKPYQRRITDGRKTKWHSNKMTKVQEKIWSKYTPEQRKARLAKMVDARKAKKAK